MSIRSRQVRVEEPPAGTSTIQPSWPLPRRQIAEWPSSRPWPCPSSSLSSETSSIISKPSHFYHRTLCAYAQYKYFANAQNFCYPIRSFYCLASSSGERTSLEAMISSRPSVSIVAPFFLALSRHLQTVPRETPII